MVFKKAKALIVDDEAHIRETLSSMLSKLDFDIVGEAANGNEAIKFLKTEIPDLVMLDIFMPLKGGDKVLEEISDRTDKSCVIMLSITSDAEIVKKCVDLGAAYYIRKDMPVSKMMSTIQETWASFQKKRNRANSNKYHLNSILEEIKEDEKATPVSNNGLSQEDIKEFFQKKKLVKRA